MAAGGRVCGKNVTATARFTQRGALAYAHAYLMVIFEAVRMRTIILLMLSTTLSFFNCVAMADLSENPMVPKEEAAFAESFLERLRAHDLEYVMSHADPALMEKTSQADIRAVADYFPAGATRSSELIGSQVNVINGQWHGSFTFEYEFDDGWAVASVSLRRVGEALRVTGFHVYQTGMSQKQFNAFELGGKSALQYAVLLLAVGVPVFILVTLIACIKTPMAKRKWLWVIFILGGIGTLSLNWTTGAYETNLLQYLLFGAAAFAASEHAPWIISVGVPVGAILFWMKRDAFLRANGGSKADVDPAGLKPEG